MSCKGRLLAGVFDIRAEATERVPGVPTMAHSPRELAVGPDAILIAVLDGEQTFDVLSGPESSLTSNSTICCHSLHPAAGRGHFIGALWRRAKFAAEQEV